MPQQTLRDKAGFPDISYTTQGRGPVVMLVHGFPDNGGLWRAIIPDLAKHYTVVCIDLPGAGGSALPAECGLTMESLADALAAVTDAVTDVPIVLAGHSMGGYAALAFAEKLGERLSGLSLVHSTAAADDDEKKSQRQKAIALIRKGGKDAFLRDAVPKMFSPRFRDQHPDLIGEQVARGLHLPDASAVAFYEAMIARPERTDVLRNAPFPVQWILGKDDALISLEKVAEQTHLSRRSTVKVYADCGHLSMLEAPTRLAADLHEFAAYCYKA